MSITGVLNNGLSGLITNQVVLRNVSDNISNVNTPGYVRKEVELQNTSIGGRSAGVSVARIHRAADQYLQAASLTAASKFEAADIVAKSLDRLQAGFGDPSEPSSLFGRINSVFSAFGTATTEAASITMRRSIVGDVEDLLVEFARLSEEIQTLRGDADKQLVTAVARVNELLTETANLNGEILRTSVAGADSSGSEGQLDQVLDELAQYIDIRVEHTENSGVIVRTTDGVLLANESAATLSYTARGRVTAASSFDSITITRGSDGAAADFAGHIQHGELRALLDLRDAHLPELASDMGDLAAQLADQINAVHADNAAVPPAQALTGRNTGLVGTDLLNFTGDATVAISDADGLMARRVDIDFDAGTVTVDSTTTTSFGTSATVADFVSALNTALGTFGSASFSGGQLTVSATASTSGPVFMQDATDPADRAGRGFAHFFGLNELIQSNRPTFFETGLAGTENHNMTAGDEIAFSVYDERSGLLRDVTYTVSGTTINDILSDLNDVTTGLGAFMTFSLDSDGQMVMTNTAAYPNARLGVQYDETDRGGTGLSFTQMFGIGDAPKAMRAGALSLRDDISLDANLLSLAKVNITSTTTTNGRILSPGDGRGALELQNALNARNIQTITLAERASSFAGELGRRAAAEGQTRDTAQAVKTEVATRRSAVEGVNMDEELIKMTIYQQAFSANARVIQAAREMYDTLIRSV
mgnify:CR=1 FL=1